MVSRARAGAMRALVVTLALLASSAFIPLAAAEPSPIGVLHCGLPTSVECIQDWIDGVGDGRWCEVVKTILGIDLVDCKTVWE